MIPQLLHNLQSLDLRQALLSILDIAVVAYFIYRLILMAKGKRAWWILIGLGVFFLLLLLSQALGLMTVNWILTQVTPLGPVAILILFYPELREILEKLGRAELWGGGKPILSNHYDDMNETIKEVARAAGQMSPLKIGALIVLEREANLSDIVDTGTALNATVTAQLLTTIFHHGTPLHDGAVVIRGSTILAAECRLPLSESPNIAPNVHLRHRAALGLSENSDAVVVVVSEETGTISIAINGKLQRGLKQEALQAKLMEAFGKLPKPPKAEKTERAGAPHFPFLFGKKPAEREVK